MLPFIKYQGTGNDFVMIDQRESKFLSRTDHERIARLCDRRFGVGADGLILLENHVDYAFEMVYFNADGYQSSMCGNGGRCIAHYAHALGVPGAHYRFLAIDGPHEAKVGEGNWVELKMSDVRELSSDNGQYILDTGSPHYVTFVEDVSDINVVESGQQIRYSKPFKEAGINVNFVEMTDKGLRVATYERGVEAETLSCGTGVTAAALAFAVQRPEEREVYRVPIHAKGGSLEIRFRQLPDGAFTDIWLCGPATPVFVGEISI